MNTNADVTEPTTLKAEMHCGSRWTFSLSGDINHAKIVKKYDYKGYSLQMVVPFCDRFVKNATTPQKMQP